MTEHPLWVVSWASQKGEEEGNYCICCWEEGVVCHIGHSPKMLEVETHENMHLGPQGCSSQSETRNREVEEVHAFCNHLRHPCKPVVEGNCVVGKGQRKENGMWCTLI